MKITDIIDSWSKDAPLDDLNLDLEAAKTPNLHAKYIRLLSESRSRLRGLWIERKHLIRKLRDYYLGSCSQDELDQLGKEPYLHRVLKTEVMTYVEADPLLIELDTKISIQEEKVEVLQEIMKSINNRNFSIKSAIEWKRLMVGG